MDKFNSNAWSLGDSESSNNGQSSKSINTQLDSLRLNSSWDSCKSDDENVARGKPIMRKSNSATQRHPKTSQTSQYVLQIIQPFGSAKSSGYSSSISPSSDNAVPNMLSMDKSNIFCNVAPIVEERHFSSLKKKQTMKKYLENIFTKRVTKKKSKIYSSQWIFDFGDTNLIKSCRCGQLTAVQETLNELWENEQIHLINHQNTGNETALSIATYQMNEVMISLLLKYKACPFQQLNMRNNVLHIAADMVADMERKTFSYLLNGIKTYQFHNLWQTLTAKNMFNLEPVDILRLHKETNNDPLAARFLQLKINETETFKNDLCRQSLSMN